MPLEPLYVANRFVAIILPKAPFVDWINAADPVPANATITLEDTHEDPSAFLIPADDSDEPGKRWIQRNWKEIFEQLLNDWYVDPSLWPRNRTLQMFKEWCEVRIHSVVLDYANEPLEYDD